MTEATMDVESETPVYGQRLMPLEFAASNLAISQKHLKELMQKYGYSIYHLGPRSKRIAEDDFRALLKITSASP
jgi:hypothetical protein